MVSRSIAMRLEQRVRARADASRETGNCRSNTEKAISCAKPVSLICSVSYDAFLVAITMNNSSFFCIEDFIMSQHV